MAIKNKKFTDLAALRYFKEKLETIFAKVSHIHDNATTSNDGFMSSEDKTKLNGLNDSNYVKLTGNQTISGTKTFSTNFNIRVNGGSINKGENPSSTKWPLWISVLETEGSDIKNRLGAIHTTVETNGTISTGLYAYKNEANSTLATQLNIVYPKTGDPYATAPTPVASSNGTAIATTEWVNTKLGGYSETGHTHNYAGSSSAGGSATSAKKLEIERAIDGVNFDGTASIIHYGTCSTAADTVAKTVACANYTLTTGSRIVVKFTVTNTVANPTLNVNSTGAKAIQYRGSAISKGYLAANRTYEFIYDGTYYQLVGDIDTNTTYSAMTKSEAITGTATTSRSITAAVLKEIFASKSLTLDTDVTSIPKNADLDTYMTAGTYKSGDMATTDSLVNCPYTGSSMKLIVLYTGLSNYIFQILFGYIDNSIYVRSYSASTKSWTAWHKVAFTDLVTTSANGLMSSADKTKLDGIETGAQVNTITGVKGNSESSYRTGNVNLTAANIGALAADGTAKDSEKLGGTAAASYAKLDSPTFTGTPKSTTAAVGTNTTQIATTAFVQAAISGKSDSNHRHDNATTTTDGFMSSTDKTKLDGIETGANNYELPTASSTTLGGVKVGNNLSISDGVLSATDTKYSAGAGISLSDTTFSNSGVRSISPGSTNGTISVNTNGSSDEVAIKGLGTAAYTESSDYVDLTSNQTISGTKIFKYFSVKNNAATKGTNPSSEKYPMWISVYDSEGTANSNRLGALHVTVNTNGNINTGLSAYKNEAGITTAASLYVVYPKTGNPYATAPTPDADKNDNSIATTSWVHNYAATVDHSHSNYWNLNVGGTAIPKNADLNDYKTPGTYYTADSSVSSSLSNCPYTTSNFKLIVQKEGGTNYGRQILMGCTEAATWVRAITGANSFNEWRRIIDSVTGTAPDSAKLGGVVAANYALKTDIPTITDTYNGSSSDGMSGKAVKSAIDAALTSAYKPSGSIAYASLPTLSASVMGNVYNVTDSFTIDNRFIEYSSGSTKIYPAGTEVGVVNTGTASSPTYKFSVFSGFIDLSGYQLANTAVTHTASTSVGSATNPVYINASGVATKCTYNLNKTVPSDALFTDTTYSAGTGLSLSDNTFNHSNSVTAGTAGTSSATSGSTLDVPYITYDAQGHITASGTHTHTIILPDVDTALSDSEITAAWNAGIAS